jgi:hypothetical protein
MSRGQRSAVRDQMGTNTVDEVVVNHPQLTPQANRRCRIIFSPYLARKVCELLIKKAEQAQSGRN